MILEEVARVGPLLILAGLMVGWIAEAVSRVGGDGLIGDMGFGLTGSVIAGVLVWSLIAGTVEMAAVFLVGCTGAAVGIRAAEPLALRRTRRVSARR